MGPLPAIALTLAMFADPAAPAVAERAVRSVSVRLHDYAHLDPGELLATEAEVADIYATIGIGITWRVPVRPDDVRRGHAVWPPDPAASLTVLVMSAVMAQAIGLPENVAGFAAVNAERGGSVAFVVADRTKRIAECGHVTHARVLSSVIAHELAHLLMPRRVHSRDGIMRANWRPWEFRVLPRRIFSPDEADDIRQAVMRIGSAAVRADN